MSKFIAASRQATELDKMRILLETTIQNVRDESKKWAGIVAEAKEKATEHQNLIKELKVDILEKDTRLDHIQKKNDELSTLLSKAKEDVVAEFKASKEFMDLLDRNFVVGFKDFRLDAVENFLEVDFNSIKLNLNAATNSLLQTSSEDVNIETMPLPSHPKKIPRWMPPCLRTSFYKTLYFSFFVWSFVLGPFDATQIH